MDIALAIVLSGSFGVTKISGFHEVRIPEKLARYKVPEYQTHNVAAMNVKKKKSRFSQLAYRRQWTKKVKVK
jgi:hypothetical protein